MPNTDDTGNATTFYTYRAPGKLVAGTDMTLDTDVVMYSITDVVQFLSDVTIGGGPHASDVVLFTLPAGMRPTKTMHMLVLYTDAASGTAQHTYHVGINIGNNGEVYKHDDSVTLQTGDVVHFTGHCLALSANYYSGLTM